MLLLSFFHFSFAHCFDTWVLKKSWRREKLSDGQERWRSVWNLLGVWKCLFPVGTVPSHNFNKNSLNQGRHNQDGSGRRKRFILSAENFHVLASHSASHQTLEPGCPTRSQEWWYCWSHFSVGRVHPACPSVSQCLLKYMVMQAFSRSVSFLWLTGEANRNVH